MAGSFSLSCRPGVMALPVRYTCARRIILTAALYQTWAGAWGVLFPKAFFDMLTPVFEPVVRPLPVLQTLNIILGLTVLVLEYPLLPLLFSSVPFRAVLALVCAFPAILLYQATNAALYYLLGASLYLWGLYSGEKLSPPRAPDPDPV